MKMTITFLKVPHHHQSAQPFLQSALEHTPGESESLSEVLGDGDVFVICSDRILGATYIEYVDMPPYGLMLNIILLAGENLEEWRVDYADFIRGLMRQRGIKHLLVLGRRGWHRLFSELSPLGTLYLATD